MPKVISIQKVWDFAEHNAFPDLIFSQGKFFCTFRESNEHAGGENGKIRILTSLDAKTWTSVALLDLEGVDLRDPMLSEMPDGRLLLSLGGSRYDKTHYRGRNPCVSFSKNGDKWSPVKILDMPDEWIWRVTWNKGIGYGVSYWSDPKDRKIPSILKLFKTIDGLHYSPIQKIDVSEYPSEVTLRFTTNDTMIVLVRRQGCGWIGNAKPPYNEWNWFATDYRLGGPNFLILPNGKMWAGSRLHKLEGENKHYHTALYEMSLKSFEPVLELPSEGDTSYPGMVYHNGLLYMSYYSSHEEKTIIYLATIDLEGDFRES